MEEKSLTPFLPGLLGTVVEGDDLLTQFVRFHARNPAVWAAYQRFTLEAIRAGRQRYSSDCICHRIRWHTQIETHGAASGGEELVINDHHTAYYARMFELAFPEHAGFFRFRKTEIPEEQIRATLLRVLGAAG